MQSFFEKGQENQTELQGKETAIAPKGIASNTEESTEGSAQDFVKTALSFHPAWTVSDEDQAVFERLNESCAPLPVNRLSLSGITIRKTENDGIDVVTFIRNGLDKPVKLKETTLILLDADNITLARKKFKLDVVGEIPALSSRPWRFSFDSKDLLSSDIPSTGWKLAFHLPEPDAKHRLDLASSWKKVLSKDTQKQLKEVVDKIGAPKKGEVNFLSFQANQNPINGDLHVTLLIQNGTDKTMELTQMPLQVEDASQEIIASANFKLDKLTIHANTSKPWTFIFSKKMLAKEKIDLSRWKASAPPKKQESN